MVMVGDDGIGVGVDGNRVENWKIEASSTFEGAMTTAMPSNY